MSWPSRDCQSTRLVADLLHMTSSQQTHTLVHVSPLAGLQWYWCNACRAACQHLQNPGRGRNAQPAVNLAMPLQFPVYVGHRMACLSRPKLRTVFGVLRLDSSHWEHQCWS